MYYLTECRTVNIKSHKDVHIVFPRKGVVRFRGENNEGKSVIVEVLNDIISCSLHEKRVRVPLIRYGTNEGSVTLKRNDGAELHVVINKEASKTYYRLQLPGREPIIRYLADKGLHELVTMFGFHWDKKREMSLNIYMTYAPLLLINTSESYNYDVISSIITDPIAESAREQLISAKKQFDEALKIINIRVEQKKARLASMQFCDEDAVSAKAAKLRHLARIINNLSTIDVPDLKKEINISKIEKLDTSSIRKILDEYKPVVIPKWDIIDILSEIKPLTDIKEYLVDYAKKKEAFENGICYACGRRYSEDGVSSIGCSGHSLERH